MARSCSRRSCARSLCARILLERRRIVAISGLPLRRGVSPPRKDGSETRPEPSVRWLRSGEPLERLAVQLEEVRDLVVPAVADKADVVRVRAVGVIRRAIDELHDQRE